MISLPEVRASNAQITDSTTPRTAVFVGGTSGIGKASLTQLASKGFPIKVYVIGRDEATHQPFLDELRSLNKAAEIVFLEGQISLMAEAKRLSEVIEKHEQRLDLLFLSTGFLPFLGSQKTAEGMELSLAVGYYSRQIFIRRLLPLLVATSRSGTALYSPRVINILGTGTETTELLLDDLALKEPSHVTAPNYIKHSATMTTTSLKRLAEKPENQGVVFIHHHPGMVSTDLVKKSLGDKPGARPDFGDSGPPVGNYVQSTPQEAGERSLYLITSAGYGGKGVSPPEGMKEGVTLKGTPHGSLFCVSDKLEALQLNHVLDELEKTGADDAIWNKTEELIGAYL